MRKSRVAHVIIVIAILIVVTIAGGFLYLKFYGKGIVESALSKALGVNIKFEGFSVNLVDYKIDFKGVKVPGKAGVKGRAAFGAEKFSITLDKEQFNKNRKIIFDRIFIERGTLHIERDRNGTLNISTNSLPGKYMPGKESVAYAAEIPGPKPIPLYNFAKGVKKLVIKDSVVEFKDYQLFNMPYTTTVSDVNLDVTSKEMSDSMSVSGTLNFMVPNSRYNKDGRVFIRGSVAVYEYMANMDISMETQNIDLMQFQPYFEKYTPFYFTEGLFSSTTKFEIHSNSIRSLTTMLFHRLRLGVKPGMQNTQFLQTAVGKLVPYLTTDSGEIVFDFTVSGPISKPQGGLGPRLKQAMGMAVAEEVLGVLQQLQQK